MRFVAYVLLAGLSLLGCSKKNEGTSESQGAAGSVSLVSKDRQITYRCSAKNYPGILTEPGGDYVFYMDGNADCKAGYEQPQPGALEQPNPSRTQLVEVPVDKRIQFQATPRLTIKRTSGVDPSLKYDFADAWNAMILPVGDFKACHTMEVGLTYKDPSTAGNGKNLEARLVWTRRTNPNGSQSWSPVDQTNMPTADQFQISHIIDAKIFVHCGWKNKEGDGVLANATTTFPEPEWHNVTYRCRHGNHWANFTEPGQPVVIYNDTAGNKVECEAGYTSPSASALVQQTSVKDAKIETLQGVSTQFTLTFNGGDMLKSTSLADPAKKYSLVGEYFYREPGLPFGRFANCHTLEYQAFAKETVGAAEKSEIRLTWRRAMNNGRLTWVPMDQTAYPNPSKVQNAKEPFSMFHMQCNWIRIDARPIEVTPAQ